VVADDPVSRRQEKADSVLWKDAMKSAMGEKSFDDPKVRSVEHSAQQDTLRHLSPVPVPGYALTV
jgi:hypothetical protein